jgi:hypothetical protein
MQNLYVVKELTLFTYFPAFVCRFAPLPSPSANLFCEKVHKAVEEKAMALLQGGERQMPRNLSYVTSPT